MGVMAVDLTLKSLTALLEGDIDFESAYRDVDTNALNRGQAWDRGGNEVVAVARIALLELITSGPELDPDVEWQAAAALYTSCVHDAGNSSSRSEVMPVYRSQSRS